MAKEDEESGEVTRNMYMNLANRLREFTRMAVYRVLGFFEEDQYTGAHMAIRNLEEGRLLIRAELSALKKVLTETGVISQVVLERETLDHLATLLASVSKTYPEIRVTEDGKVVIDRVALKARAERERWEEIPNG